MTNQIDTILVSRNGLTWLLAAQVLVILPHLLYSPWWLLAIWAFCAVWRIQIYRMRLNYPKGSIKFILVLALMAGVFYSRGTLVGLDGGVVLLIVAFSLKLLELRTRRDALVVIYLGFIAIAAAYLFNNSFLWVLYSLFPIVTLLAALIGLYQTKLTAKPMLTLRLSGILFLQAIPLMLVLFFLFPRFEPLWTFSVPKKQQTSGISNSMTPGELADMAQSAELVFRANFEGQMPPRNKLYWRVLTLESYNGRTWNQMWDVEHPNRVAVDWQKGNVSTTYTIVMQPNARNWLASLDVPDTLPENVLRQADFHLTRERPVDSLYSYRLTSWLEAKREPNDLKNRLSVNLRLPNNPNQDPRARAKGLELRKQYGANAEKIVEALLKHYREQPYYYTLQTPDLGQNSVDKFFFDTRSGFCEHYASATTFILRSAGIPARVVLGYQGGEINTNGNFVQVRQMEAHAWVEYWQQGKGWITIDPTFQVAPDRIEQNLGAALNAEDQARLANPNFLGFSSGGWMESLRMHWENFNNRWDLFMLGYNSDQQQSLLKQLFGKISVLRLVIYILSGIMLMVGLWLLILLKPWRQRQPPTLRYYFAFERLMRNQGISPDLGEGPIAFGNRASKELPAHEQAIHQFINAFTNKLYAETGTDKELRNALNALKKQLSWRKKLFK